LQIFLQKGPSMSLYDDDEKFELEKIRQKRKNVVLAASASVFAIVTLVMVWPLYRLYSEKLGGLAKLKEAEYSRKIAIEEAEAKKKAAKALADAEVIRARGVAEANKIIGESLNNNEAYLRYLWVQGLQDGKSEVIYVPTEANLPILEATRPLKKE